MWETWNMAVESSLNPSDPDCLTRDTAVGSSTASTALKLTSPNTRASVSGWALSCWHKKKDDYSNLSGDFKSKTSAHSQESWICEAVMKSQPGSQIQTWLDYTLVHIHQHQCRETPSVCCRRKNPPGSAQNPPWHDHIWCHLKQEENR